MKRKIVLWYTTAIVHKVRKMYIDKIGEDNFYKSSHRYAHNRLDTAVVTSKKLEEMIISEKPFMAARYGLSEMYVMRSYYCGLEDKMKNSIDQLERWSGFYPPTLDMGKRFTEMMLNYSGEVDYLATNLQAMESYFIRKYMRKNVVLAEFRAFEPWYENTTWTCALKGKKVLVIHPFVETIEKQYKRRKQIFDNENMLPNFDLILQKAIQTSAGEKENRFKTWFEALDYMYDEAMKKDFDIALLGCGAYGFPLAAKLKKSGKQAIHMGGMLQILFGIKGKRWDDDRIVAPLYNEFWVRPDEKEKPQNSNIVEGGCYW